LAIVFSTPDNCSQLATEGTVSNYLSFLCDVSTADAIGLFYVPTGVLLVVLLMNVVAGIIYYQFLKTKETGNYYES